MNAWENKNMLNPLKPARVRKHKANQATVTKTGQLVTLAPRVATGTKACPGDAHSNAHIDHCGVCLGGEWGRVVTYEPLTPEACVAGFAVDTNHADDAAFEAAEKAGKVRLVSVERNLGGGSSVSFMAWVST